MKIGSKAEQYAILIKGSKGKALEKLISEVLSASNIWTFGEFLNMDDIKAVLLHHYSIA